MTADAGPSLSVGEQQGHASTDARSASASAHAASDQTPHSHCVPPPAAQRNPSPKAESVAVSGTPKGAQGGLDTERLAPPSSAEGSAKPGMLIAAEAEEEPLSRAALEAMSKEELILEMQKLGQGFQKYRKEGRGHAPSNPHTPLSDPKPLCTLWLRLMHAASPFLSFRLWTQGRSRGDEEECLSCPGLRLSSRLPSFTPPPLPSSCS